jgi:CheY-like chemotaxis protein
MGSNITLTSEIGKGSEFSFVLDLEKVDEVELEVSNSNSNSNSNEFVSSENLKAKKIIVAEDDELNQQLIRAIFKNHEVALVMANNGIEVLEFLKSERFDLILMDMNMPVLDGMETTRIIREELQLKTPIIALTANEAKGDRKLFENLGINDHITKPYKKESLFEVIRNQFVASNNLDESEKPDILKEEQLYSLHTLREMSQGDTAFLTSIVETFIVNTPKYMDQIETAFETKDFNMVYRAAHQMKPSIDFFNIEKGKQLVRNIELEAKNENPNLRVLEIQIKDLKEIVLCCVNALKDELLYGF